MMLTLSEQTNQAKFLRILGPERSEDYAVNRDASAQREDPADRRVLEESTSLRYPIPSMG